MVPFLEVDACMSTPLATRFYLRLPGRLLCLLPGRLLLEELMLLRRPAHPRNAPDCIRAWQGDNCTILAWTEQRR